MVALTFILSIFLLVAGLVVLALKKLASAYMTPEELVEYYRANPPGRSHE